MRQMKLIEILLPLSDAAGRPFPAGELQRSAAMSSSACNGRPDGHTTLRVSSLHTSARRTT
jgi:hypothetical protein